MPEPLRGDVRLLGSLLGKILVEYGGQELLDDVEALRHIVIATRRDEKDVDDVAAMVGGWSLDRAELVARAFTVYFHLTNLAEEHQRIRTLRARDDGGEPQRESVRAAVREIGEERIGELLGDLELRPVLTAHPTEARRRAVVTAILRISALLTDLDDPRTGSGERDEITRRLLEEIDLLWRTSQLRRTKPDPLDEVRTAMAIFDETLFRVVPAIYRSLDSALAPGTGARPPLAPAYLRFGSWIGGDRDGNPYVTAQITREAIGVQADHLLRALALACARVGRTLTAHESTTPPSTALRGALAAARAARPDLHRRHRQALAGRAAPAARAVRRRARRGDPAARRRPGL